MIAALIDASIVVKWYHDEGEEEVAEARAVLRAVGVGLIEARILDLTIYEYGNVLLRRIRRPATEAMTRVEDLLRLCGAPLTLAVEWRRDTAELAERHGLTYYDAAYAAVARGLGITLISADRQLVAAGLAESATDFVHRLRLPL